MSNKLLIMALSLKSIVWMHARFLKSHNLILPLSSELANKEVFLIKVKQVIKF